MILKGALLNQSVSFPKLYSAVKNRSLSFLRGYLFSLFGTKKQLDPLDALIICADPRGGSTWLYEMLMNIEGVAGIWEPLHIGESDNFKNIGFSWRHYIPEDHDDPVAREMFEKLFRGGMRDPYLVHRTRFQQLRNANFLLFKFCRASQLLPWLTNQFEFSRMPIHLVRHPCAVVSSQMRYGAWDTVTPGFTPNEIEANQLFKNNSGLLSRVDSVEGRLAAIWAMSNAPALNRTINTEKRWITLTYEDLISKKEESLQRVLEAWGLDINIPIEEAVSPVSGTTLSSSPVYSGESLKQLSYWKDVLSPHQIKTIINTVNDFGVDLYDESIMPRQYPDY